MPNSDNFSATVLIADDDPNVTAYLRRHFHQETSVGVLVASSLGDARKLVDDLSSDIHAVLVDLLFAKEYQEPEFDLRHGFDLLERLKRVRPQTKQYVLSIVAEDEHERQEAEKRHLTIAGWWPKIFFGSTTTVTPWAYIERDLVKGLVEKGCKGADPDVIAVDEPSELVRISEVVRALSRPLLTYLQELPDERYRLRMPLRVTCVKEAHGGVSASAPTLGLLTEGYGDTVEDALKALAMAILDQKEMLEESGGELHSYSALLLSRIREVILADK
jgi:CheY-like chemotaxis protein